MWHEIVLAPQAVEDMQGLTARWRSTIQAALETHLRHEPTRASRSRIKQLWGMAQPQFRLRVGDWRIFYDVSDNRVEVLAIISKAEAARWLREKGRPS